MRSRIRTAYDDLKQEYQNWAFSPADLFIAESNSSVFSRRKCARELREYKNNCDNLQAALGELEKLLLSDISLEASNDFNNAKEKLAKLTELKKLE